VQKSEMLIKARASFSGSSKRFSKKKKKHNNNLGTVIYQVKEDRETIGGTKREGRL